jgi:hypothetical protein
MNGDLYTDQLKVYTFRETTGFTSRRLLRLAGLRSKYSYPPPHGVMVIWKLRKLVKELLTSGATSRIAAYIIMLVFICVLISRKCNNLFE